MTRSIYFLLFFAVLSPADPIINNNELSYLLHNIDFYLSKPSEPVFVILKENAQRVKKVTQTSPQLKSLPTIKIGIDSSKPTISNPSKIVHFSKQELKCIKKDGQSWIDQNMSQIDIQIVCKGEN